MNELTGVGAAIAAGNQAENGIWALLVKEARIISRLAKIKLFLSPIHATNLQSPKLIIQAIPTRINTSPTRLESTVNVPAFKDL